jgi:hypothetical protein
MTTNLSMVAAVVKQRNHMPLFHIGLPRLFLIIFLSRPPTEEQKAVVANIPRFEAFTVSPAISKRPIFPDSFVGLTFVERVSVAETWGLLE